MYNHFLPLLSFLYLLFIQLLPLLGFEPSTFHFALWLSMFAFGCLLQLWFSTLLLFCLNLSETARILLAFNVFAFASFLSRLRLRIYSLEFVNS